MRFFKRLFGKASVGGGERASLPPAPGQLAGLEDLANFSLDWRFVCARCGAPTPFSAASFEEALDFERQMRGSPLWRCGCGRDRFKLQHWPTARRFSQPEQRRMPRWDARPVKRGSTIFVLGAGFSVEAGAPVAEGFFERPRGGGFTVDDADVGRRLAGIQNVRDTMARAHAERGEAAPRIDEIFAAVNTYCAAHPSADFKDLRYDLMFYITRVLQDSCLFYLVNEVYNGTDDNPYNRFVSRIAAAHDRSSVICLNYDPVLEFAFARLRRCNIDYGVWRSPADLNLTDPLAWSDRDYTIFKPHGSTTWLRCGHCGNIYFKGLSVEAFPASFYSQHDWCRRCKSSDVMPLMVAPEFGSDAESQPEFMTDLLAMAMRELHVARRLVFIGHSLPGYDGELRLALLWSTLRENSGLEEITVVDPSRATLERYRDELSNMRRGVKLRLIEEPFGAFAASHELDRLLAR